VRYRLSWPYRQLLRARKYIVSYRKAVQDAWSDLLAVDKSGPSLHLGQRHAEAARTLRDALQDSREMNDLSGNHIHAVQYGIVFGKSIRISLIRFAWPNRMNVKFSIQHNPRLVPA